MKQELVKERSNRGAWPPAGKEQIRSFEDLRVWQRAHRMVIQVFELTNGFPEVEKWGLSNQMRRCSSSIGMNLAKGVGRHSRKELIRFLYIARGSLEELKYQIRLATDLKYIHQNQFEEIRQELNIIGKMLNAFINALKNKP